MIPWTAALLVQSRCRRHLRPWHLCSLFRLHGYAIVDARIMHYIFEKKSEFRLAFFLFPLAYVIILSYLCTQNVQQRNNDTSHQHRTSSIEAHRSSCCCDLRRAGTDIRYAERIRRMEGLVGVSWRKDRNWRNSVNWLPADEDFIKELKLKNYD